MPPPTVPEGGRVPLLPAPAGPIGPPPTPAAPAFPAGEPNIFTRRSTPSPFEPEVRPASTTPAAGGVMRATVGAPVEAPADDLPPLPK